MNLTEAIYGRRSVREYADAPVDEDVIRRLVSAATQAPSAVNLQPWTFATVRDREQLGRVSREAKAHMLATMPSRLSGHFGALLSDPHYNIFHGAPLLIVISADAQGPWIVEDCALAAENLMLAAFDEGLGTCWIGFAQNYQHCAGQSGAWPCRGLGPRRAHHRRLAESSCRAGPP